MYGISYLSFSQVCPNEYPRRLLLCFGMLPSAPVDKRSGKAEWMVWWSQYFYLQANFVFRDASCQTCYGCICGVTLHFCLWNTIKGFSNLSKIIQIPLLYLWSPLFLNLSTCLSLQASLLNMLFPSLFCLLLLLISSLLPPYFIAFFTLPFILTRGS